jgi:hypothetical protein
MSLEPFLSRLQKVKRTSGNSWMACCPAHDDRTPSLTVRDADGRILIHCFAGCDTRSILNAVGMDWEDVMPEMVKPSKPERVKVYPSDALKAIQFETLIVAIAAYDMAKGKVLDKASRDRLMVAVERINAAGELANV